MRLERASVKGFGRLRGVEVEFSPNMTVIWGENASGKTTLQRFLVAVIYGFPRKGGRPHPEQMLYKPWEAGEYRGSLLLSFSDGRRVEISRDFSKGTGEGRVLDLSTGRELRAETLYRRIGLDRRSFEAVCIVRQMEVQEIAGAKSEARRALQSALERLAGGPDATAREAEERLEKALKLVGKTDGGEKTYRGRAYRLLEREEEELRRAEEAHRELEERLSRLVGVNRALEEASRRVLEARRDFLVAKERELRGRLEALRGLEGRLRKAREELGKWEEFSKFPEERERELNEALVRREEAERAVRRARMEERRARDDWERARKELEEVRAVEEVLGPDPERALSEREREWGEARTALEEARRRRERANAEREEVRSLMEGLRREAEGLEFVSQLGPRPMERLWETRTRWREGRESRERERRRASQRRGEAEGLRREARMLSRRAGMLFPLGAVVAVAGIVGLVGGLMWQRWMLALTALLPVGLSLLAWGRAEALRAKGLEREALRREEESSQWLEEAERVYSQVEDEARRLLKALGSYEGGEVKEEHFERAREVILRWEEVRRRLSDLERRAREVEESAGKARGEEEAARRRLEEEEGRLKVVLEMIGALAEGERPSPEAFERAWAAIKRWKEAKGAERKAKALLEEAVRNLREAEERLERAEAEVERILKEAKVESVEEFKRRAEGRRNFDRCLREVEGLERQIKALLAGRRREDLEAELERTEEERRELEEKVPELKGKPLPEGRPEELEEAEREARREESKLREEKRGLEEVIERIRRGPSLSEARARLEEAKWRYRREKEFSEELQWALDALREATQRFGERWAERLSDEIEPLAQRVLPRAYAEIHIASDLSLQVRPERGEKFFGPEHLSTGEREQIFLMLRACAARELSLRREPLPMILDEPFGHIDRPRREKLWRFLLDLSKEVQIVILTCHKEHLEEATKAAREKGLSVKTKEVGELDIALLNWPSEAEVHG